MNEELYKNSLSYLEWIEENRDEWSNSRLAPLLEEIYECLEVIIDRLEKNS